MADPRIRQFKIQTGVVKRLTKEKTVYEKEVDLQRKRLEKIKAAGQDEYVVRKEEEVLQECMMMVPDCTRRLGQAFTVLSKLLENESELKTTSEYIAAQAVIAEAKLQLPNSQ